MRAAIAILVTVVGAECGLETEAATLGGAIARLLDEVEQLRECGAEPGEK